MLNRRSLMIAGALLAPLLGAARAYAAAQAPGEAGALVRALKDRIYFKGQDDYETFRQLAVWNARKPPRFPEAIVMAESVEDVVAAVKLAKARGWKVGVRSGGHSWYAAHMRDKSILINLQGMTQIDVKPDEMLAVCSPSVHGQDLNIVLQDEHGLMFPSAHGVGVGLGGFVMCGGHGWNSREFGLGCLNLKALDIVTADGELIHASETENSDWWWAARGAGPGFFGAAVRFYLQVHKNPSHMRSSRMVFDASKTKEVVTWVRDQTNAFPKRLEVVMLASNDPDGKPQLALNAVAFAHSEAEAAELLNVIDQSPLAPLARQHIRNQPAHVPWREELPNDTNPTGMRFAIDGNWSNASGEQLAPLMERLVSSLPTPGSYVFWQCWGPPQNTESACYSVQGDVYISPCAVYEDEADDARGEAWVGEVSKLLEPMTVGSQMNDENMANVPKRYLSDAAYARLEQLRAKHDPEGRFVSFNGRPVPTA